MFEGGGVSEDEPVDDGDGAAPADTGPAKDGSVPREAGGLGDRYVSEDEDTATEDWSMAAEEASEGSAGKGGPTRGETVGPGMALRGSIWGPRLRAYGQGGRPGMMSRRPAGWGIPRTSPHPQTRRPQRTGPCPRWRESPRTMTHRKMCRAGAHQDGTGRGEVRDLSSRREAKDGGIESWESKRETVSSGEG